eukprot:TRINITY_DN35859_c0_g1_i1.p1 TRINITY_DN35859_c0_g1~~TRINITY_DN35859_c0_g1_i1.p1  ORF type:complete len:202 (+),score=43.80 TRINITY_DN35859_c0_g1_i1:155-760(+)
MAQEKEIQNGGTETAEEKQQQVHPLENAWTFWFDNPSNKPKVAGAAWGSSIRKVFTFNTVEEFWSLYNNLFVPSKLPTGADFHLFKDGIEPKWEDPACAHGGKWSLTNARGKAVLDQLWLNTLLAMIGEQFVEGDEICGVVVSVRARQEKIALWTRSAANEAVQMSIGRQWKEALDTNDRIQFFFHEDAKKEKNPKSRYLL